MIASPLRLVAVSTTSAPLSNVRQIWFQGGDPKVYPRPGHRVRKSNWKFIVRSSARGVAGVAAAGHLITIPSSGLIPESGGRSRSLARCFIRFRKGVLPSLPEMAQGSLCSMSEHPPAVLHLTRTVGKNAAHPSGTMLAEQGPPGLSSPEVLTGSVFQMHRSHSSGGHDSAVSLYLLRTGVWRENWRSRDLEQS